VALMREIEWDACLLEPRSAPEVERRFRRETGRPDSTIRYFAGIPWLEDAMIALSVEVERRVALAPELADLVGLVVSQDNSCRYCFAATRAFLLVLGMSPDRIARLEQNLLTADLEPRERAALEFARRVSRSNPLPGPADLAALRQHGYSELEISEIAGSVGLHVVFNRMATLSALPPGRMENLPDRWTVRLLRPLVAFSLRKVRRRVPPRPLAPDERKGPFAQVVNGLDGLPLASTLRRTLDGMWASDVLPRRTKALVFAVVGRALGCPLSEGEGRLLAAGEGLDAEPVDEILAHLASPVLDPVEQVAVPFARETVWYQPAQIQRRARQVMEALSRDRFLELISVAALANMVCRLGIVAEARR
jgi:AhpD family alkylhydroperoxidase